jgi:hypothetical protein
MHAYIHTQYTHTPQAAIAAKNATKTAEPAKEPETAAKKDAKKPAGKDSGKKPAKPANKPAKDHRRIEEYQDDTVADLVGSPKGFTVCDKNSLKELPMPA